MSDESPEIDLTLPNLLLDRASLLNSQPLSRAGDFLLRMQKLPPQALLIEGGSLNERMAAAIFWACLLNCDGANGAETFEPQPAALPGLLPGVAAPALSALTEQAAVPGGPCLHCSTCIRLRQATHRDFFILDGRAENIKIAAVREVRSVLGEPPREARQRIVLLAEAQNLGVEAANALLKSLEEPKPHTSFVLTVPQRERLLPTLVSRSWILTLPWPNPGQGLGFWEEAALQQAGSAQASSAQGGLAAFGLLPGNKEPESKSEAQVNKQANGEAGELQDWEAALAKFLSTGTGWFARTGSRGALGPQMAALLLCRCQSALAATLVGSGHRAASSPLASLLRSRLASPSAPAVLAGSAPGKAQAANFVARACKAIDACQQALHYNVNPALSLDWLAVRLFIWLEELRRQK